jgi:hypothetical protein
MSPGAPGLSLVINTAKSFVQSCVLVQYWYHPDAGFESGLNDTIRTIIASVVVGLLVLSEQLLEEYGVLEVLGEGPFKYLVGAYLLTFVFCRIVLHALLFVQFEGLALVFVGVSCSLRVGYWLVMTLPLLQIRVQISVASA